MAQAGMSSAAGEGDDKGFLNAQNLMHNMKIITACRTSLCAVAGIATGILGCTGSMGLILYLITYATVSLALLAKMGFDRSDYTAAKKDSGIAGFLLEGESNG
eukprot:TRINITY_DN1738_c0_g1_i2.p1 TRINITY_DN1738_c0_g1~~TRINITY_DN1738_c0_g1_i2.p1  ORF type:complete len:103 (-),score=14.97 TRINITY_DN1738_c0_g1_i2:1070-1378(-)